MLLCNRQPTYNIIRHFVCQLIFRIIFKNFENIFLLLKNEFLPIFARLLQRTRSVDARLLNYILRKMSNIFLTFFEIFFSTLHIVFLKTKSETFTQPHFVKIGKNAIISKNTRILTGAFIYI